MGNFKRRKDASLEEQRRILTEEIAHDLKVLSDKMIALSEVLSQPDPPGREGDDDGNG